MFVERKEQGEVNFTVRLAFYKVHRRIACRLSNPEEYYRLLPLLNIKITVVFAGNRYN